MLFIDVALRCAGLMRPGLLMIWLSKACCRRQATIMVETCYHPCSNSQACTAGHRILPCPAVPSRSITWQQLGATMPPSALAMPWSPAYNMKQPPPTRAGVRVVHLAAMATLFACSRAAHRRRVRHHGMAAMHLGVQTERVQCMEAMTGHQLHSHSSSSSGNNSSSPGLSTLPVGRSSTSRHRHHRRSSNCSEPDRTMHLHTVPHFILITNLRKIPVAQVAP